MNQNKIQLALLALGTLTPEERATVSQEAFAMPLPPMPSSMSNGLHYTDAECRERHEREMKRIDGQKMREQQPEETNMSAAEPAREIPAAFGNMAQQLSLLEDRRMTLRRVLDSLTDKLQATLVNSQTMPSPHCELDPPSGYGSPLGDGLDQQYRNLQGQCYDIDLLIEYIIDLTSNVQV